MVVRRLPVCRQALERPLFVRKQAVGIDQSTVLLPSRQASGFVSNFQTRAFFRMLMVAIGPPDECCEQAPRTANAQARPSIFKAIRGLSPSIQMSDLLLRYPLEQYLSFTIGSALDLHHVDKELRWNYDPYNIPSASIKFP
jgi:hypothetical protein